MGITRVYISAGKRRLLARGLGFVLALSVSLAYFCKLLYFSAPFKDLRPRQVLHQFCLWSMVPQSWLSDTAEKHYVVRKTLPQDIARANIERSINILIEGMDNYNRDFAKLILCRSSKKSRRLPQMPPKRGIASPDISERTVHEQLRVVIQSSSIPKMVE